MTILFMTIPVTFLLISFFVVVFLAAVKGGQFEDLETPAHSILINENEEEVRGTHGKK